MIERLAALPPVPGALDQIVQRFGTDQVAEVTGRSRRIVRKDDRLCVENRAGSANLAEAQAFMDDEKRILVFSDAGGTGRSYHADLTAPGTGGCASITCSKPAGKPTPRSRASAARTAPTRRSRRCSGRSPPTSRRRSASSRPSRAASTRSVRSRVASVRPAARACSAPTTISNSVYGRAALRQLYFLLYSGKVEGCSLQAFEDATGSALTDGDGGLREELPPISTFSTACSRLPSTCRTRSSRCSRTC